MIHAPLCPGCGAPVTTRPFQTWDGPVRHLATCDVCGTLSSFDFPSPIRVVSPDGASEAREGVSASLELLGASASGAFRRLS